MEYIKPVEAPQYVQDELARLHAIIMGDSSTNTKEWAKDAISKIHKVLFCAPMIIKEEKQEGAREVL
jgi:hypothetical protein